jgi:cobyrinic acid a,c-diamide synthase
MYLCRTINDFGGQAHPMVDIIPAVAEMGKVLTMGYRQIKPCADNFLFPRGSHYQGHEFHRSQLVGINPNPILTTSSWHEGHCNHQGWLIHHVFASYLHLHWGANPDLPRRWLAKAAEFNPIN